MYMYIIVSQYTYVLQYKLHAKERYATQNHYLEFLIIAYTFDFSDKN